jgi:hypothetical protein
MSQALSSVAREEFDSEVKHAYQGLQTLRGCIKVRNNVNGDRYDFRLMGKGAATVRTGSSADVVPMDVGHSVKVATLVDYEAPEYTDVYDQATVNFDEVVELATTIAGAMGRRDDQSIIDAMATSTNTLVDATPGLDTLINASERLNSKDVPAEDRYFICDEAFLKALLNDTTLTSADYATVRALQSGTINSFMGFEFKIIASGRAEGGLGGAAYAIHKSAVGHAVGIDMKTKIDYVPHKASYLSMGMWKAGSVLIDVDGCVKITAA